MPSGSTGRSAVAPASWLSSTEDAQGVAAAASSFQIATCTPSAAVLPRRRHTLKQPTRAYQVSVSRAPTADSELSGDIFSRVTSISII